MRQQVGCTTLKWEARLATRDERTRGTKRSRRAARKSGCWITEGKRNQIMNEVGERLGGGGEKGNKWEEERNDHSREFRAPRLSRGTSM